MTTPFFGTMHHLPPMAIESPKVVSPTDLTISDQKRRHIVPQSNLFLSRSQLQRVLKQQTRISPSNRASRMLSQNLLSSRQTGRKLVNCCNQTSQFPLSKSWGLPVSLFNASCHLHESTQEFKERIVKMEEWWK